MLKPIITTVNVKESWAWGNRLIPRWNEHQIKNQKMVCVPI
jgi:hypothetical protein